MLSAYVKLADGSYSSVEIQTPISTSRNNRALKNRPLQVKSAFEYRRELEEIFPKVEESIIFKNLERKYHSENILNYIFYPTEERTKLHFLGDIFQYDAHFIEASELRDFLRKRFNVSYKKNYQDDEYSENLKKYIKYNCVSSYIPEGGFQSLRKSGWDAVPEHYGEKHLSEDDGRIVCAGCLMGKRVVQNFLMTAIDTVSNSIVIFSLGLDIANLIRGEFKKHATGYSSIDQWIFEKDFIITSSGKGYSKKNDITVLPSSYSSFKGEIIIPSKEYVCFKNVEMSVQRNHSYNGSFFSNLLSERKIKMADVCKIDSDNHIVSFARIGEEQPYKTFEIKKHAERNMFASSSIGILEI